MLPEPPSFYTFALVMCIVFGTVLGTYIALAVKFSATDLSRLQHAICNACLVASLLCFLWLPWVFYGVHYAWAHNMALVPDPTVPAAAAPSPERP